MACNKSIFKKVDARNSPQLNLYALALKENPDAKIVAFVHAETSTGVRSDAETIAKIAKVHDCLVIADTVTSLAGIPVMTDEWGLDAVYSGSQKCLSSVAGLSPLTFSDKAIEKITNRSDKIQSWFLDQTLVLDYWSGEGKRSYHHTAPINSVYALLSYNFLNQLLIIQYIFWPMS